MRKGHALQGMKRHEEAVQAFKEGLEIEPENTAMQQGLKESESNLTGEQILGRNFIRWIDLSSIIYVSVYLSI